MQIAQFSLKSAFVNMGWWQTSHHFGSRNGSTMATNVVVVPDLVLVTRFSNP